MSEPEKILDGLKDTLVDNVLMIRLGLKAKAFIVKRVQRAEYLEGSTGGKEYSTTPMPVPYGLFIKKFGRSLLKKEGIKKRGGQVFARGGEFSVYRSKSGKTMVLISGGYKRWRELNKKNSGQVEMSWSARMLRNLGVLRDQSDNNSVKLGFTDSNIERIAYYHNIAGAGKNKITRKFMDLDKKETEELADYAEEEIIKKLVKNFK